MLSFLKPKRDEMFRSFINELINGSSSYVAAMEWAFETRRGTITPDEVVEVIRSEIYKMSSRRGYPIIYMLDLLLKFGVKEMIDAVFTEKLMGALEKYLTLDETPLSVNEYKGFEENLSEYIGYSANTGPSIICTKDEMELILSCWNAFLKNHTVYPVFRDLCKVLSFNLNLDVEKKVSDTLILDYRPKHTAEPPGWKLNSNCFLCQKKLSFIGERHHCRNCGESVCEDCSKNRIPLPHYLMATPRRVCDRCVVHVGAPIEASASSAVEGMSDDKLLQKATELSLSTPQPPPKDIKKEEEEDELQLALTLSLSEHENKKNSRWQPKSRTQNQGSRSNTSDSKSMFPTVPSISFNSDSRYESSRPIMPRNQLDWPIVEERFNRTEEYIEKDKRQLYFANSHPKSPVDSASHFYSEVCYERPVYESAISTRDQREGAYAPLSGSQQTRDARPVDSASAQSGLIESFADSVATLESRIRSSRNVSRDQTVSALMKFIWSQHPQFSKLIQDNSDKLAEHERIMKKFALLSDVRMRCDQAKKQQEEYEERLREEQALLHQLQTEEKLNMLRKQQKIMREHQEKLQNQLQINTGNIIETALPNMTPSLETSLKQQEFSHIPYPSSSNFSSQPHQYQQSQGNLFSSALMQCPRDPQPIQQNIRTPVQHHEYSIPQPSDSNYLFQQNSQAQAHYSNIQLSKQTPIHNYEISHPVPRSQAAPAKPAESFHMNQNTNPYFSAKESLQFIQQPNAVVYNPQGTAPARPLPTKAAQLPYHQAVESTAPMARHQPQDVSHEQMIQSHQAAESVMNQTSHAPSYVNYEQPQQSPSPQQTYVNPPINPTQFQSSSVMSPTQNPRVVTRSQEYVKSRISTPVTTSMDSDTGHIAVQTDSNIIRHQPETTESRRIVSEPVHTKCYSESVSTPPPSLSIMENREDPIGQTATLDALISDLEGLPKQFETEIVSADANSQYNDFPSAPMALLVSNSTEDDSLLPSVPAQTFESSSNTAISSEFIFPEEEPEAN